MSDSYINRISVRNLVEFIMRSGDIDNRSGKGTDKEAMIEGTRLHKKIQGRMGADYRAEVSLKYPVETKKYNILLEGRADGIITNGDKVIIDEIKCLYKELELINEPVLMHKAQALCYAYIYSEQNNLDSIQIQITYCNIMTEEIKYFREKYTFEELKIWFDELISKYIKWVDFEYENLNRMKDSAKNLEFPFEYRKGQKDIVVSVYKTISRSKNLFVQAPTGVGKTMSVLFPSIKAMGEGKSEKIFYLTAKNVTGLVAKEAISILNKKGLDIKAVGITAKERMCPMEECDCNPEYCKFAKGHYDRINDAVFEFINNNDNMYRENILEFAIDKKVCPFEMNLDIATWCNIIICDYNYVFDINVKLKRFFAEGIKGRYTFLIDEAHNLVERGRQMYSSSLVKEDFVNVRKKVKPLSRRLYNAIDKCNSQLLEYKRACEGYTVHDSIAVFESKLLRLYGELEKFRDDFEEGNDDEIVEFYLNVRNFLYILECLDENYVIYSEYNEDGNFILKLFCINPANNLSQCIKNGSSAIFFSATFLPIAYYKSLLSIKEDDYAIYIDSPFDKEKRLIAIGEDVSSKYIRRNDYEFSKMAEYIKAAVIAKMGNYMVFFPSYKMLYDVLEKLYLILPRDIKIIYQKQGMKEEEREEFLRSFENESEESILGLCVMGGVFSEGIDLKNESLIGAIVIGCGLPQISNERVILKDYYDELGMNGFEYAYVYPGMNKVLQAAGRVIRTKEDVGIILLLDERFLEYNYSRLFPREWDNYCVCNLNNANNCINDFWDRFKEERCE